MSKTRLPTISDPLKHIKDLTIHQNIKPPENITMEVEQITPVVVEEPVNSKAVFGRTIEKPGIVKDEISSTVPDIMAEEPRGQGKRGKDKAKRKKKVMSEKQLSALAKGRANSLAKRQAKKAQKLAPIKEVVPAMPKPAPAEKLDYSTFSNYMDMYEEKKKKKHYSSTQPHPNKIINEIHRPTPPRSKPQVIPRTKPVPIPRAPALMNWNGNINNFRTNKQVGKSRWNYGI
tara:strand:- start:361 stop:1053 length:693 start_codon:yes stop_codon:yes gene_type:complete